MSEMFSLEVWIEEISVRKSRTKIDGLKWRCIEDA